MAEIAFYELGIALTLPDGWVARVGADPSAVMGYPSRYEGWPPDGIPISLFVRRTGLVGSLEDWVGQTMQRRVKQGQPRPVDVSVGNGQSLAFAWTDGFGEIVSVFLRTGGSVGYEFQVARTPARSEVLDAEYLTTPLEELAGRLLGGVRWLGTGGIEPKP